MRVFLLAILVLLPMATAHSAWEITNFVVYEGRPVDADNWREQEEGQADPRLNPALVREIENFLFATAKLYEGFGFPDPVAAGFLDSVVTDEDGELAIRVYVFPSPNSPGGWYSPGEPCSTPSTSRRILNLNAERFETGPTSISDANYQTIAHELFHPVQYASRFREDPPCARGLWVTEGTADAVGYYAARRLRNLQFNEELETAQFMKVFGAQQYSRALNKPLRSSQEHYFTSSFWRYLAEVSWARKQSKTHAGSRPSGEDYTYLAELFDSANPYGFGPAPEITWLSEYINRSSLIPADLASNYSQFVSSFADYINTRIGPLGLVTDPAQRETRWLKRVFGGCPLVGPPTRFMPLRHEIPLRPNMSQCFATSFPYGDGGNEVRIEVIHADKDLLRQLQIGVIDGSLVSKPLIASGSGERPMHIASWSFPVLDDGNMVFIVSNMAGQPAATRGFEPSFRISAGDFHTDVGPLPPSFGPQPPTGPAATQPASTTTSRPNRRELQEQQIRDAIADPANHLVPVTKAERLRYDRSASCTATDRRLNLCRSQLRISLAISPIASQGNLLDGNQFVLQEGSIGAGFNGMALDMAFLDAARRTTELLGRIDGSKITVTLPRLEYGFTGDISNASIWVAKANDNDHNYISYGPTVRVGGREIHRPPNGRVTIEEYGPLTIRGNFNADLIDQANSGPDDAPIVARTIRGEFLVPSPWQGDDDFDFDELHIKDAFKANMLQQTPFGTSAMDEVVGTVGAPPRELCDQDFSAAEISAMGFLHPCSAGGNVATGLPVCTCDCAQRTAERALDNCARTCRARWNQCPVVSGSIPDDLESQVNLYRHRMTQKKVPESMQQGLIDAFRSAPEFQRRMILQSMEH